MIFFIIIFVFLSLIIVISNIPIRVSPYKRTDTNSIEHKILKAKRLKSTDFPKPYPNTWYFVCNSKELKKNIVKPFNAFGEEMVIFRTNDGKVGILNAYCPHLGTHLGHGGNVSGNTIECPYHKWAFDIDGICKNIPYCDKKLTDRLNTKKYYTIEKNNMIFVWYHSSGKIPDQDDMNIKILDDITTDYTYIFYKDYEDYHMHIMEPSQNSADWYHFKTVHSYLPIPLFNKLIWTDHVIDPIYTDINCEDTELTKKFHGSIVINEKIVDMKYFKFIPIPKFLYSIFTTNVIIETPALIMFIIEVPYIGEYRGIMTLQPIEPYRQRMRLNVWAKGIIMKSLSRVLTYFVMSTVEQDREVWENRMQNKPRNIVLGDGPWATYSKWIEKYYDKNSKKAEDYNLNW